jgi:hypothetical protein
MPNMTKKQKWYPERIKIDYVERTKLECKNNLAELGEIFYDYFCQLQHSQTIASGTLDDSLIEGFKRTGTDD